MLTCRYNIHSHNWSCLGYISFQMCWEKNPICNSLILSWDQCPSGMSPLLSLPELFDSGHRWKPLYEASSGSQALFFVGQIDGHSCRLKVIPVEMERTVSQPHPSWDWSMAVWAHLCCAWFGQDIKLICLISHLGGAEHCNSRSVSQLAPVSANTTSSS